MAEEYSGTKNRGAAREQIIGASDGVQTHAGVAPSSASAKKNAKKEPGGDKRLKRKITRPKSNRTGGPRTEEGRVASSQNALTHGAFAAEPSGRVEYECHREEVRAYLCPLGKVETVLVDQIAHEMWRVMSLNSHEMQATMIMEGAEPDLRGLARKLDFPYGEKLHHMLAERVNESALRRRMRAFWLASVDDLQDPDSSDDDTTRYVDRLEGLRALSIEVLAFFESRLSDPEQWELVTKSLDRLESQVKAQAHPLHDIFASDRGLTFWAEFWVMRNQLRISEAKYLMIHSRVIEFLSSPNLVRARLHTETTLAKQIDRLGVMQESRHRRRAS